MQYILDFKRKNEISNHFLRNNRIKLKNGEKDKQNYEYTINYHCINQKGVYSENV